MTPKVCAAILVSLLTSATALTASAQQTLLTGTISYRERMALPATAVVEVRLEDVTRVGAPPAVLTRYRLADPGAVPIRFNLDVDTSGLDRLGRYALRATIMDGARVLFTSTDTVLVLTQGHGTRADLVLTRVTSNAPAAAAEVPQEPPVPAPLIADLPATFVGTLPCADCEGVRYHLNLFGDDSFFLRTTRLGKNGGTTDDLGSWTLSSDRRLIVLKGREDSVQLYEIVAPGTLRKLDADGRPNATRGPAQQLTRSSQFRQTDVRAAMRGAYTYLADAATFVECSTGQRWTVAAESVSRDLEAAYLKVRPAPGAPVVVDVDGLVVQKPRADGGAETALVVERVRGLRPKESCPARFSGVPLTDTQWRLTHLGDRTVPVASDPRRQASLTFLGETNAYAGSSGCNRVVGTYAIAGATMTLTSGGTMVACKEEAKNEEAFLAALKATRTYRVTGQVLELTDANGVRLARFEAKLPTGITVR